MLQCTLRLKYYTAYPTHVPVRARSNHVCRKPVIRAFSFAFRMIPIVVSLFAQKLRKSWLKTQSNFVILYVSDAESIFHRRYTYLFEHDVAKSGAVEVKKQILYCKVPCISPGAYRNFIERLGGLIFEGPLYTRPFWCKLIWMGLSTIRVSCDFWRFWELLQNGGL